MMVSHFRPGCGNCIFFCEEKNKNEGFCHRFPPQVIPSGRYCITSLSEWPKVFSYYWCGEFKLQNEEVNCRE